MASGHISLPPPGPIIEGSLTAMLQSRRSIREFSSAQLEWEEVGALLWAGQGITDPDLQRRAAPSAGALYPLELDAVTRSGVFRYEPPDHAVRQRNRRDVRSRVVAAGLGQPCLAGAPCIIAISAVPSRSSGKYGERAPRYIDIEAGHVAQNVLLTACTLGLGAVPVGAFDDAAMADALELAENERPVYLVPVGWPRAA